MPPHPAPFRLAAPAVAATAVAATAVLAMLAGAAAAAPQSPPRTASAAARPSPVEDDAGQAAAALVVAQDRAARAAAGIDELERELRPGHLTDPMPETDRAFGLASLRSAYADAQLREAGDRATLGDQHPTLMGTVQLMEGLRARLLEGTRKALASAERDAADARADIASAERRLAAAAAARSRLTEARAADVTGSIAAAQTPARAASPLSLPPAALGAERPPVAEAPPVRPMRRSTRTLVTDAAAAVLASLLAAWAVLRLLRPRRPRADPIPARRVEPALVTPPAAKPAAEPEPRPAAADAVPILQRLALPLSAETHAASSEELATAATELHATLRAAFGGDAAARMTVLVAPAAGLAAPAADAAAFALALAAAASGRRPLLMEARAAGRLRGALVPPGSAPMLIDAGGASRTLYRLGPAGAPVALLPSDAGEAEAALAADARPGTARLRGLDAFDTVILVGDGAALAANADLLLLAAPAGAAPAALAEAALSIGGGRPCGAVLVEATPAAAAASPVGRTAPLPRRRLLAETAPAGRLGLRGSIEPMRRRIGG